MVEKRIIWILECTCRTFYQWSRNTHIAFAIGMPWTPVSDLSDNWHWFSRGNTWVISTFKLVGGTFLTPWIYITIIRVELGIEKSGYPMVGFVFQDNLNHPKPESSTRDFTRGYQKIKTRATRIIWRPVPEHEVFKLGKNPKLENLVPGSGPKTINTSFSGTSKSFKIRAGF